MIIYTIDAYDKNIEDLLFEIEIPVNKLTDVARIMEWTKDEEKEFSLGIGVYNVNENQAIMLESLLHKKLHFADATLQLSGGSI